MDDRRSQWDVQVRNALDSIREIMEDLIRTNPVTGLPDGRAFRDRLARWKGAPLGMVAIEINGFKNVNSRYGHQGGDQVLEQVGDRLRSICGPEGDAHAPESVAYHLSGDEFALLIPEGDRESLLRAATLAQERVSAGGYSLVGGEEPERREVTISVAVGHLGTRSRQDPAEAWQRLDELVEYQKFTGHQKEVLALWDDEVERELQSFRQRTQGAAHQAAAGCKAPYDEFDVYRWLLAQHLLKLSGT
jgi:diguanylate cyclase (GGDEF)-like protein